MTTTNGILYLVATPIGNLDDLMFRARRILSEADVIVGEEPKEARVLLKRLGIESKKLMFLSEHSTEIDRDAIMQELVAGRSVALISDAGTPVFADPGYELVQLAIDHNIQIVPIPGPSSIAAAIVASGFPAARFVYRGFLPRETDKREQAIKTLNQEVYPVIIMEAPYRLQQLLLSLHKFLNPERRIALCWQLTMPDEEIVRGTVAEVIEVVEKRGWKKGEFVVVEEGKRKQAMKD
jgi:16S rRNA (cytidine1402-2'-O)-methyltransferase